MTFLTCNKTDSWDFEIVSVSEALRKHFGTVKVKGTLIGMSKLFKLISKVDFYCDNCQRFVEFDLDQDFTVPKFERKCDKCNKFTKNAVNFEYKNAVIVELQDIDTFNDMDRLPVILFDNDTEGIRVGDMVIIKGDIRIIENKKGLFTHLYAESIQYLNREDFILTKLDIEAIKRFGKNNKINTIDKLVSIFDLSIAGYDHVKKGILYSAVNTSTKITKSEHLDILLIGDPGLTKTKLLKRATELVPGSSMESAQNSSGKSITAIIEKADDNTFLRLGAIPRSRDAFCGLNELGRMSIEDQVHLLDVMQERELTINKHGIHAKIRAPTAIIGSANPINRSTWKDNDKIDLNEFPILEPIIDRFDLIFPFKKRKTKDEIDKFVDQLSEIEDKNDKGLLPNYTPFLIKYIQYAKQFNPILTDEARTMLKEFYKKISTKGFGSPRVMITLFKLTKAIARLKLKEYADEEDARETMDFYNVMLLEFQKSVVVSQSPREIAYQECVSMLEQCKEFGGITLEELITKVCQGNKQLANYFEYGKKQLKIENNKKVRNVYDMLLNHSNIKKIQDSPIVLQWLPNEKNKENNNSTDLSDSSDQQSETNTNYDNIPTSNNILSNSSDHDNFKQNYKDLGLINNYNNSHNNNYLSISKTRADRSYRSDSSFSLSYKCNHCNNEFQSEKELLNHSVNYHPGKPALPDKSLIELMKNHESELLINDNHNYDKK